MSEPTGRHRSSAALAVAFAAVGVPALFAGTLVVAVRRRRSIVYPRP